MGPVPSTDPLLRARMGGQAAEYAQSYSWRLIAERMLTVYAELAGEKARA